MVGRIYHVGLTVSDLDRSIVFYRDILGLKFQGEIFMEGEETDKMFRKEKCKARVAYLNGSVYKTLTENHVECLSEPQYFDFRADGFGESRAFYFRDPDGIILEMMQPL